MIDRGKLLKDSDLPTDGSYKRFRLDVADGVSPRSVPGQKGGVYFSNSYEHDEMGRVIEGAAERVAMAGKRLKKTEVIQKEARAPHVYGDENADVTFVSWGSSRGPVVDAMTMLRAKGKKANLVHFTWLYPFPEEAVTKLLKSAKRIVDVEQNATGQLAALIREHTGILITEKVLKFDGRPFYPEEIVERIGV